MKKICCICGKELKEYGYDPYPFTSPLNEQGEAQYCCDICNEQLIVAEREWLFEPIPLTD